MYSVYFYRENNGNEPVLEYLKELSKSNSKDNRVKLKKIQDYIEVLSQNGLSSGLPFIKHIKGELWELRPKKCRIFFVAWIDNSFVLLHCFDKKTMKTPRREIKKAIKEIEELKKRGV